MSQFTLPQNPTPGVQYEVPTYVSSPAPTAPMVARPTYNHTHSDHNMDPNLTTNMDPYLTPVQAQSFQLQLQAVAASEAAISNDVVPENQGSDFRAGRPSTVIETPKQRRLGRACDACSKRKVKCGEEVPCRMCVDLDIQCTFQRPAKRRGPANKVAADLKRLRGDADSIDTQSTVPASATNLLLSVESVAPYEKIQGLVFDFFTYLFPIYPFPPETLILDRLDRREDRENKSFLALIISMVGLLASTFPRRVHEVLPDNDSGSVTTLNGATSINLPLIHRCTDIALSSLGPIHESRDVDDAATCFFLAMIAQINGSHRQFKGHLAESMNIIRSLCIFPRDDFEAKDLVADPITKELSLRIFWAIYMAIRSRPNTQLENVIPTCRASNLPDIPTLDDEFNIYGDQMDPQAYEKSSLIKAVNLNTRVYRAHHSLRNYSLLEDDERALLRDKEVRLVVDCLQELDAILSSAHPELSSIPAPIYFENQADTNLIVTPHLRAHIQTEIQKIFVHATLLSTRLHLTEWLTKLRPNQGKGGIIAAQYTKVIQGLALLLKNVSKASVEPCANILDPMLRNVWHALCQSPKGIEQAAEDYGYLTARFVELFGDVENARPR